MTAISQFLKAVWLFIAGIFAVLAMYFLLTGVEQGVDVVISAGESFWGSAFTILSVFLWAFLVWYSSRILSYVRQMKNDQRYPDRALLIRFGIPTKFLKHIPRVLAFNCFVCVQMAILHLPTFYKLVWWEMVLLICAHNAFYFLLSTWFATRHAITQQPGFRTAATLAIVCYLIFLGYVIATGWSIPADGPSRHRFWLSFMMLFMFLLEILSVYLFIRRRERVDRERRNPDNKPSVILDWMGLWPDYNRAEKTIFFILQFIALIGAVIYASAIYSMHASQVIGPMAFTLVALGVIVGLSNIITLFSIRASFNLFIVVYLIAFTFGMFRDPYKVRLMDSPNSEKNIFAKRPDMEAFLHNWFTHHISLLDSADEKKQFPVYMILSNGGASRAGNWTTGVLSRLQDATYDSTRRDSFQDHIISIGGASGGTIGNAVFYSLMVASKKGELPPNAFSGHAKTFFETDFLTYTLARMLGPDMLRHLSPVNTSGDRASALADVMADGSDDELISGYFNKSFSAFIDHSGKLPLLFFNSTQVDNGMPGVISNVKLRRNSRRTDILSLIDKLGDDLPYRDIEVSTAAVLSSRFPYVSPAGRIYNSYFVDGGYFDNSGAGTVLEFVQELRRFLDNTQDSLILKHKHRFNYRIIHLTNSEIFYDSTRVRIHPLTNDLFSPILTLAGMQGANTSISDDVLINEFRQLNKDQKDPLIEFSLYNQNWPRDKRERKEFEEGYPMSWIISRHQLQRMKMALDTAYLNRRHEIAF